MMPISEARRKIGPGVYVPWIMLTTGFAISVTVFLLRTSRFASIENRTDALGPALYDELAPALPMEQVLLVTGVIIALAGLLGLITSAIRSRRRKSPEKRVI